LTRTALPDTARYMVMDKAYEGDETRQLVEDLGLEPVVPPKANRVSPWNYDRVLYNKRNEVERLFRRLKVSWHYEPWLRYRAQCGGGSW